MTDFGLRAETEQPAQPMDPTVVKALSELAAIFNGRPKDEGFYFMDGRGLRAWHRKFKKERNRKWRGHCASIQTHARLEQRGTYRPAGKPFQEAQARRLVRSTQAFIESLDYPGTLEDFQAEWRRKVDAVCIRHGMISPYVAQECVIQGLEEVLGVPVTVDASMPEGEIHIVQDGRVASRIVGIGVQP